MIYKKIKYDNNVENSNIIYRVTDNAYIPTDPDNTDYAAYLKWLEAGNTPQPADEVTK
jgi:hypothetical protein